MNDENTFGMVLADAIKTQAMRPQKTSQTTVSTTKPVEYADMLARRNQIGAERQALADALKKRENFGYSLASALSAIPQQQGYGSWLSDLSRSFGAGFNARTNAAIDRAQQDYEAAQKDLASALALDKAMGDVQTQEQTIGYTTPMTTDSGVGQQGAGQQQAMYEVGNENLADLYQTINANPLTFSMAGGLKQGEESRALRSFVNLRGVETLGRNEFAYLQSIMPAGFTTAINSAKEQELMRPYTTGFSEGTGSAKKAAIKGMISTVYDAYAREAQRQGLKMPMSRQEYINSRIEAGKVYNPEYVTGKSDEMYIESNKPQQASNKVDVSGIPYNLTTTTRMSVDLNSIKSGENKVMPGDVITFSDGSTVTFKGDGSESDRQILEALQ